MNKNAQISAAILAHIANGADVATAVDAVLGDGTYLAIAGDVWETLRARAGVVA